MKQSHGKLFKTWAIMIIPFLAGAILLSPTVVFAGQSVSTLEERVRQMEEELRMLRRELTRVREEAQEPAQQVEQLEERVAVVERTSPSEAQPLGYNMLFFRGGYTELNSDRGNQVFTDFFGANGIRNNDDSGWYVGAGFDYFLSDNVWGLVPSTSVFAELGIEYKKFDTKDDALRVVPVASNALGVQNTSTEGVTLSMLTVSASPKLKYTGWGKFQPWIIPAGLDFHVISPPSDAGTVLDIGVQFAAGLDYEPIRGFHVGVDGRYHLAADETNGVENDHWTAGGYLGIHF